MSDVPICEQFLIVGTLKPKLKWFFKPKLKPNCFLLNWAPPLYLIVYLSDARDRDRDPLPRVDVLALHLQGHRVQPQPEGMNEEGGTHSHHRPLLLY